MSYQSLEKHLKTINLDIKMKQKNFDSRNKVLNAFRNPDEKLMKAIKTLKKVRNQGLVFNCGPSVCYPCDRGYFGNTYTNICPSCETILKTKFFHLYNK